MLKKLLITIKYINRPNSQWRLIGTKYHIGSNSSCLRAKSRYQHQYF